MSPKFTVTPPPPPPVNSAKFAGGQNRIKNKISSIVPYKRKDIAIDFLCSDEMVELIRILKFIKEGLILKTWKCTKNCCLIKCLWLHFQG